MNKVILCGRLTRDPEAICSQKATQILVVKYNLAVDRPFKRNGESTADFINCVVFGKAGEFAEKYFRKGTKIIVSGRIHTGSYMNNNGQKVYTTDVVVEEQEFAEKKERNEKTYQNQNTQPAPPPMSSVPGSDGWMNIPDGIDESLPFD